ncbi:hypothetical protein [Nocardioides conyzicola]|uniref:WD40 repeat domain-containing protein n=1 Tax=Nocardioides conyzicola TaxID=1651781 RepID=A0ABP8Y1Z2_9ACTN
MTTLHDRLTDLAEEAPAGGPVPDLWERGRRVHLVRRAGTLGIVAAAVLLLAVIVGVDWQRSAPEPTPARGTVGLPDRVWAPSPWLPSTDRPGQLVALSSADKGTWTGAHSAVVGISASSGEYAFVDLPGAELENGGAELAPDGQHIAYWLRGTTTGTPLSESGPITGVAVYDLRTGDVAQHWITTPHGLSPEFLTWADTSTVVFSAGQIRGGDDASGMDQSSASFGPVAAWSVGGEPRPVAGVEPGFHLEGAGHGRILVGTFSDRPSRGHLMVDVADPTGARFIEVPDSSGAIGSLHYVSPDASGRRIALVPGNSNPHQVYAGVAGDLTKVPRSGQTFGVVDWIDPDTIVTLRRVKGPFDGKSALYRVSISTGTARELVRFPVDTYGGSWQFATDLLDAPSVEAVEPPSPVDPRATATLSVLVCLAAAIALVLWRRRVRA